MTVKHMRIFSAVYQEKSITRAAEKLHMTQPAVTRAIHEIENHWFTDEEGSHNYYCKSFQMLLAYALPRMQQTAQAEIVARKARR